MELWELDVEGLRRGYARRLFSPLEVVDALLNRIEALDPDLGAFRQVLAEPARLEARQQTQDLAAGYEERALLGIPVVVKELFDVEGALCCFGSLVFAGRTGPADAAAVVRLRTAGAIILGITRSHEFGWGITTQHPDLGSTRNPWSPDRVPGGSSGGSAAALAAGMAPLALGTDTGGSVRIPAALCGVTGLKPTYGAISTHGVVPLAPSLDHVGAMARTAGDLATAFAVLAGFDPEDPATRRERSFLPPQSGEPGLAGVRVGIAPSLHLTPLAPDHEDIFADAVRTSEGLGAEVGEVQLPEADRIRPAFAAMQMAEAHHTHTKTLGTYPGRADRYGIDVRGRLEAASRVTVADYLDAQTEARVVRHRFGQVFDTTDVILTPVSAGPPSSVDDPDNVSHLGMSLPFRDLVMDYTVPQDLAGLPAVVVPAGFDSFGLPVGLQITADVGREDTTLSVAAVLQDAFGTPAISERLAGG